MGFTSLSVSCNSLLKHDRSFSLHGMKRSLALLFAEGAGAFRPLNADASFGRLQAWAFLRTVLVLLNGYAACNLRRLFHAIIELCSGRATRSTARIAVLEAGLSTPGLTCHQ